MQPSTFLLGLFGVWSFVILIMRSMPHQTAAWLLLVGGGSLLVLASVYRLTEEGRLPRVLVFLVERYLRRY
jgi:hypothetical protein